MKTAKHETYEDLARRIRLVDTDAAALGVLFRPTTGTTGIIRRTWDGQFAVVEISGKYARLNKLLPDLEAARRYNRVCARQ